MTRLDPNTAVLNALGIDWKGLPIAAVNIRLRPNALPQVHIVYCLIDKRAGTLTQQQRRFTLTPSEPGPKQAAFDIDAACQQAVSRIVERINNRFAALQRQTDYEFACSRSNLNRVFRRIG